MSGSSTDPPPERSHNQPKPYLPPSSCAQVHASRHCTWKKEKEKKEAATAGISIVPMSAENSSREPPPERCLNQQGQTWQQLMHRDKARGEREKKGCDYRQQYCANVPMSGSYGKPPPERSLNQARPDMTMHRDTAREGKKVVTIGSTVLSPHPHPLPTIATTTTTTPSTTTTTPSPLPSGNRPLNAFSISQGQTCPCIETLHVNKKVVTTGISTVPVSPCVGEQ